MPYKIVRRTAVVDYTWWELDPLTGKHVACAGPREVTTCVKVWDDPYAWCGEMGEIEMMKKRTQVASSKKAKWEPSGDPHFKAFPNIEQHLSDMAYEDGSPREPSKLTVQLNIGGVALQLTDPDNRSTAFTNAELLSEAMALLEEALASGRNPWRPWPKHFGKK